MTNKENLANNHLIAIFMGFTVCDHYKAETVKYASGNTTNYPETILYRFPKDFPNPNGYTATLCQFDLSWEMLMPVVEKITNTKFDDGDTAYLRTFGMKNSETGQYMVRFNRYIVFYSDSLINATYQAIIEFIKWHNK